MLLGEPLAHELRLRPGDVLELPGEHGPRRFPVAGVFYDYTSTSGTAVLSLAAKRDSP